MRLYEKERVLCTLLLPSAVSDGEGGYRTEYTAGTAFRAHFRLLGGQEDDIGGQVRTSARFTVTVPDPPDGLSFSPGDVFCEDGTGKLFTVTGEAERTPACASFSFLRFPAERWENASVKADGKEDG